MTPAEKVRKERELLEKIVKTALRFRDTPIIDDDFVGIRNEFDSLLSYVEKYLIENIPVHVQDTIVQVDGCMGPQESTVTRIF